MVNPSEHLYNTARLFLGFDASPDNKVDNEVACAESVNHIFRKAFGKEIGGGASTAGVYQIMKYSDDFDKIWEEPVRGDIIISPTGYGDGRIANGHIGIMSDNEHIMSNTSANGLWEENLTISVWAKYYRGKGGYPILFYRVLPSIWS